MANNRKISNFISTDTIPSDALITFVSNGTNFVIPYSTFLATLGVTGTIEQIGDPLAAATLDKAGTVNRIRNMESGAGIKTSISPLNGVQFDHNFQTGSAGQEILTDSAEPSPILRNIAGVNGISVGVSIDGKNLEIGGSTVGLANQVAVTQAAQLSGTLDSSKEYFIDGLVDMGNIEIEVPLYGLTLSGYNFDVSKLFSSTNGHTMFTSGVGGCGNLIIKDMTLETSGTGSKLYNFTGATGNEAIEIARVNFSNCTSMGTINNFRQGLEAGTGRFGGTPELELDGAWAGGYFIDTSIVRNLTDGAYSLFKAGATFTMESRFRSNQNIDLPASVSILDFTSANFNKPSTLILEDCIVTRNGVSDASDSNLTPNIASSDLKSAWNQNNGLNNTFVGGESSVSVEVSTTLTASTYTDLLGTSAPTGLQHFDSPANGQLRHLGTSPIDFKVGGQNVIAGDSGDVIGLKVVIFRDATTSFEDSKTITRVINNLQGGRDVAYFVLSDNITLNQNDYVKIQIANLTGSSAVTAEIDSFFTVEAR